MIARGAAILVAGALAIAACGSDDDSSAAGGGDAPQLSGADAALAEAIAGEIRADDDPLTDVFDADCIGASTVAALGGAARIGSEYGVTVDNPSTDDVDLSADDAEKVGDAYAGCNDLREVFLAGFAGEGGLTDEQGECLLADISGEDIQAVFVESLQGIDNGPASTVVFDALFARVAECGIE